MAKPPPQKLTMTIDESRNCSRNLGIQYARISKYEEAIASFNKFMQLEPMPYHAADIVHRRCQAKRSIAQIQEALEDAFMAASLNRESPLMVMAIVDALHELNAFEQCAICIYDSLRTFSGRNGQYFHHILDVLIKHFNRTVDESYLAFMMKKRHLVLEAWQSRIESLKIDLRPKWKILKEKGQCDVLSVQEKEEILLSPLEMARRTRALVIFSQHYLKKNWRDVLMLRHLHEHKGMNCPQLQYSTPRLHNLLKHKISILNSFLGILHARNPLYNIHYQLRTRNPRIQFNRDATMKVIQFQTNRTMHNALRSIRQYVKNKEIDRLTNFIETIMGDYVVRKTLRVMPWRFEFINEVYNHLALALIHQFKCPHNIESLNEKLRLKVLYNLPIEDKLTRKTITFGDFTSYNDDKMAKRKQVAYKHLIARLEKRLIFARHNIERAYLYYRIGSSHLEWHLFDKCYNVANKGIREARSCNSNAWQLLNYMLVLKSQISLNKMEIIRDVIVETLVVAQNLKNINMCCFLEQSQCFAKVVLSTRRSMNFSGMNVKRSKRSITSQANSLIHNLSINSHMASSSSINEDKPKRGKVMLADD